MFFWFPVDETRLQLLTIQQHHVVLVVRPAHLLWVALGQVAEAHLLPLWVGLHQVGRQAQLLLQGGALQVRRAQQT